jgi:hypothetical protein
MREVISGKGSRFLLCRLSATRPSFPKYPPQPVTQCPGHTPRVPSDEDRVDRTSVN